MVEIPKGPRRVCLLGIGPIDPPIGVGEDYLVRLDKEIRGRKTSIEEGDVIAIASKVVAYSQSRVELISRLREESKVAELLQSEYGIKDWKASVITKEADRIIGGFRRRRYVLTIKNGIPVAKAGADTSNAPRGHAILHPLNPMGEAKRVAMWGRREHGTRIGALIVDTKLSLFRRGVMGAAMGYWGFDSLLDYRGTEDIFGRKYTFTVVDVVDQLASAASLVMGEGNERIPFVLIKGAPITLREEEPHDVYVTPEECYFYNSILNPFQPSEGGQRKQ